MQNKEVKLVLIGFMSMIGYMGMAQPNYANDPAYGPDSASRMECARNLSTMSEFAKIKLYDRAWDSWISTYQSCPGSSKNIYIYGERILEHKIESASAPEEKNKYVDMMLEMYDKRIEHFGQEGFVLGKKGIDLLKFRPEEVKKGYDILKKSIQMIKPSTQNPTFVTFIQAANILFKNGELSAEQFAEDYFMAMEYAEQKLKATNDDQVKLVIETMEKTFIESGAATCEMLIDAFNPKYEANPEDVELLKKITTFLRKFDCNTSDLFSKAAESLFKLEPSSDAAYNLAKLFLGKEDYSKAAGYYEKAIEMASDGETKGQYLYELGVINMNYLNNLPKSRSLALKAAELKPNWGVPYILIGNIYASAAKECGENSFQQAAVYWAVVDKYAKAKAVDPSVADQANDLINKYSQHFPNNEDAFFYGFTDGDQYTVGCWINEKNSGEDSEKIKE